ncbi:MAG: NAD(P)/FAD-dependent oxidoreductase [Agathobacter sp.]
MKQYVIIGGGIAAVGCIEGIRTVDKESKILLITQEEGIPYCRPLISYYLQGKTDFEKMKYRPDSFYPENNCEIIHGTVVKIMPDQHSIALDTGDLISYDALCVATGSSPFIPPFNGLDKVSCKYSFMTEQDTLLLEQAIDESSRVLIVGAGLIGLKCAEGLCDRVKSITVCDLATRVLSSILDDTCASMMQQKLEEHGICFLLGDSVEHFDSTTAHMTSGKEVPFDVLVLAVGVRPNTSLVKDIGGNTNRGILVDTSMQTSISNIYSAGDCTEGYDASSNETKVLAILPNAYMQGNCAGVNMAGGSSVFDTAIPMNAIGFFGLHALTAGRYSGEMYEEKSETSIKRLFIEDNLLVGFMMIGDIDKAGIYTALIREKTPLDTVDLPLLKAAPSLIPFSSEYRRKKLGGGV